MISILISSPSLNIETISDTKTINDTEPIIYSTAEKPWSKGPGGSISRKKMTSLSAKDAGRTDRDGGIRGAGELVKSRD